MLCSLANDDSGDIYKIITITWDGSCKECYIRKQDRGHECVPRVEKDVLESELAPISSKMPHMRIMTPPPDRQWTPAPSEPEFDQEPIQVFRHENGNAPPPPPPPPIQIFHHDNGNAPPAPIQIIRQDSGFDGGYDEDTRDHSFPKPAYVEDYRSDEDEGYEGYEDKPPLSPAMAERGMFPADEEYYSSNNRSYESRDDDYDDDRDSYERRDDDFGRREPTFIALGPPADQSREFEESTPKTKRSHGDKHRKKHHRGSERSERSERSEKSDSERGSRKSSKTKRSRRNSTSSEKEEKKEKKESSKHRMQKRKPSLFGF